MARLHSYIIHDDRCRRCGRCTTVCEANAISIPQGHAITGSYGTVSIDQDSCTGCGACLNVCKLRAISKVLKPHF